MSTYSTVLTSIDNTITHTSHNNLKRDTLPVGSLKEPIASDPTDDDILYTGSGLTLPQAKKKGRSRKSHIARGMQWLNPWRKLTPQDTKSHRRKRTPQQPFEAFSFCYLPPKKGELGSGLFSGSRGCVN
jgi:hypothetical protein